MEPAYQRIADYAGADNVRDSATWWIRLAKDESWAKPLRHRYIGENLVDLMILHSWCCTLPASALFWR